MRKGITSVGDLDPLTSKIINENSLFDSSDNNILSSLSPDGSGDDKLDFSNLNDAASNLAADDKTSSSLNLDSGDGLFFGGPDGTDSDFAATDDSLFNLGSQEMTLGSDFLASDNFNGGGSSSDDDVNFNPFLTADAMAKTPNNCNPNTNTNTNNENSQSLNRRRNRPRSSTLCSSSELQPPLPAPREGYLTPLPFLETDEEIKRFFCPAEVYQGILNIPVCAIYDDFGLLSSDVLSFSLRFIGSPLLSLGLMDVAVGRLSKLNLIFLFAPFFFCWFSALLFLVGFSIWIYIGVSSKQILIQAQETVAKRKEKENFPFIFGSLEFLNKKKAK